MELHLTIFDVILSLVLTYLPTLVGIAVFVTSVVVYRRRTERGFLVLSTGMGLSTLASIFSTIGTRSNDIAQAHPVAFRSFYMLLGVFSLVGWTMLAKKKPNQAPEPTAPSGRGSS